MHWINRESRVRHDGSSAATAKRLRLKAQGCLNPGNVCQSIANPNGAVMRSRSAASIVNMGGGRNPVGVGG